VPSLHFLRAARSILELPVPCLHKALQWRVLPRTPLPCSLHQLRAPGPADFRLQEGWGVRGEWSIDPGPFTEGAQDDWLGPKIVYNFFAHPLFRTPYVALSPIFPHPNAIFAPPDMRVTSGAPPSGALRGAVNQALFGGSGQRGPIPPPPPQIKAPESYHNQGPAGKPPFV
jgi:hypothetical protein